MVRVKGGVHTRRKHKKVLELAKGFWMTRHKQFKKAKEGVLHAGEYAFVGRKLKKRNFKSLWIVRLNAAMHMLGKSYKDLAFALNNKKVGLDRKVLSQIAIDYPKTFEKIVTKIS
jgi:large subunit ribosomal protein L20